MLGNKGKTKGLEKRNKEEGARSVGNLRHCAKMTDSALR